MTRNNIYKQSKERDIKTIEKWESLKKILQTTAHEVLEKKDIQSWFSSG